MWPRTLAHFHFFLCFFNFLFPTFIDRHRVRERERVSQRHTEAVNPTPELEIDLTNLSLLYGLSLSETHKFKKRKIEKNHSLTQSHFIISFPITTQFSSSCFRVFNWELNWNGFPSLQARNFWNSVGLRLFFIVSVSRFRFRSFALSLVRFFFSSSSLSFVEWLTGEWLLEIWIRRGREAEVWERSRRGEDRAAVVSAKTRRN